MKINKVDIKEIIQDKWVMHKYERDGAMSKTVQFMLPSLELTISTLVIKAFVNAYMDDANYEHEFTCPIFLLFKIKNNKDWSIIYDQLIINKNYILDYNCGSNEQNEDLVMVVFEVPERFKEDYFKFKLSRYSKFSKDYKKKFPQFIAVNNKKEETVIWQVINKSEKLKREMENDLLLPFGYLDEQDEIWGKLKKDTEIYNYKKINEHGDYFYS